MIPRGEESQRILEKTVYAFLWFLCVGFLVWPSWAQKCSGLSRFVLISGLVALYLAWPGRRSLQRSVGALLGFVPVLCLALALDQQAGLHDGRALWLIGHGTLLCVASACLGSALKPRWSTLQAAVFAGWFLLPLAVGLWSHVASGSSLVTGQVLAWSPLGSFWQALPLRQSGALGLDLHRNVPLVFAALVCVALFRFGGPDVGQEVQ